MKGEYYQKVKRIFQSAVERAPDKREAFLKKACAGNHNLRRDVEKLLSSFDSSESFMERPAVEEIADVIMEKLERLKEGHLFSYYRIAKKIGAGGMGEVYLAEDTRLDRRVVLKILPPEFAADKERMRRFIREAKSASALNHPNIITIYEIGEIASTNFIAAEYVTGETLHWRLKRHPLDLKTALDIAIQVASALDAAHRAGIIHRDIKPENIMIRPDGLVKVLDFGIAKLISDVGFHQANLKEPDEAADASEINPKLQVQNPTSTSPGMIIGTAAYMSPEQARGKAVDTRSDIFSFGIVFYEMLTDRRAFTGETPLEIISSILKDEPTPLNQFRPEMPREVERITDKMLRKDPDERYQRITEALNDLRRVKQRLDYDEVERTLSPDAPEARTASAEHHTAVTRQQPKQSSDSGEAVSMSSTISGTGKLPPNNLSAELSPLIGREAEIAEIEKLLRQPDIRLLTITGVGGTGKTRLAQSVAHKSLHDFTDGTYFINLSAIEAAALVVPVIAQTLGVREESGKTLKEKLGVFLSERKILLVLDNFEQIAQAAPDVGELLLRSKNLKILVTSRVRLHLRFEREFVLPPLAVPTGDRLGLKELGEYAAVALFVERARAAKSSFGLTEENAAPVAEICRRLDGLPLAMELAAAHVKLLAPQAICARLSNSLKLLTGGARDLPARQQTMWAAIKWSYDLLDPEEQKLLNRLAVFGGGFTLDEAERIAKTESDLEIDSFAGIRSLADKSLLAVRERADGEPRFRMLVVVREFALERLEAGGEANQIKRRHAEYFAALAEEAYPELVGAKAGEWLERLEEEHDNLRFALEWSLENEPEIALRIIARVWRFWSRHSYLAEGVKWIRQTLEKTNESSNLKLRARAYSGIAALSMNQGDLKAAESYGEEGLRIARASGEQETIVRALNVLGLAKQNMEDYAAAKGLYEEALAAARTAGNKQIIAVLIGNSGTIAHALEDYALARKYYEEAYRIAKVESIFPALANQASNLAETLCLQEDYEAALPYALEALEVSEKLGDRILLAHALDKAGAVAVAAGESEKAARLWGAARAIFESKGFKIEITEQRFLDRYETRARAAIGDAAFETAHREGQSAGLKNALALARESS